MVANLQKVAQIPTKIAPIQKIAPTLQMLVQQKIVLAQKVVQTQKILHKTIQKGNNFQSKISQMRDFLFVRI